ncbi:MAG: hypothetical protein SAJ12_21130, partial [Jaaginema sp. PMC 1079.18]|nr:hypothetical protein [Jaaginema sp. PMC 1079.18]
MTQLTSNKRLKKILLQFYGLAFVTIAAIMAIAKFNNIKISLLVDDPAAFADYPSYVGLLSMIGILILGATAAICFFSAFLFKSTNAKGHRWQRFILVSGLLSLVFVCDDLWLIHENYAMWLGLEKLLPPIPGIGMEDFFEGIVFGLYGMAIAAY